jgi:hypothetical protein
VLGLLGGIGYHEVTSHVGCSVEDRERWVPGEKQKAKYKSPKNWKIAFLRVTLPWADGTEWQRDLDKAMASIGHPLNHDSSNVGVIRSKRTVKQCVGVKRTYNLWCGCQVFLSPAKMSDLGDSR